MLEGIVPGKQGHPGKVWSHIFGVFHGELDVGSIELTFWGKADGFDFKLFHEQVCN